MKVFKAHGLGNDYLVLEDGPRLDPAAVVALCDRHHGLGADGILEPMPHPDALAVKIWNPDGSEAERSGNGLRIFAYWASHYRGAGHSFTVVAGGDRCPCTVEDTMVDVRLATASIEPPETLLVDGVSLTVNIVSMGNPHCVIFVDGPPEAEPWRRWGEVLERHPRFPERTNVQVATVLGPDRLEARIWERGAGPTLASGSSACAVAFAAVRTGRCPQTRLTVAMPGGSLEVSVHPDDAVDLRGPVAPIARLDVDWLVWRA